MSSLQFLNEAFQLISQTTVQGVLFGFNFSIYFLCNQLFYRQYRKAPSHEREKIILSFLYISVLLFAAALELGADARYIQLEFIDHGGNPEAYAAKILNKGPARLIDASLFIIGILNPVMQVLFAHCFSMIG
jgi:hypothetical protein